MSKLPQIQTLTSYLRDERRLAQRQQQSSAFNLSGTSVTAAGETTVDGKLTVTGAMVVGGTLSLPAGIIDNAALASPVMPQDIFFSAFNFALSTTSTVKASATITVPAGFTSAVVSVVSRVFAYNPNTTGGIGGIGGDYLGGVSVIAGASGNDLQSVVLGSGSSGVLVSPYTDVLSGLTPGGTFVLSVKAHSGFLAWSTTTGNTAEMSGTILWFR
jgi:hypothetical protein